MKLRDSVADILSELKQCLLRKDLQWAKRIHAMAKELGCDGNRYVITAVIKTYAKCGCMVSARGAFDSIRNPSLASLNTLLLGYAANGQARTALELFSRTKPVSGCAPDSFTYVAALKACACLAANGDKRDALEQGKHIHIQIGTRMDAYVQAALIDMYSKCGSMQEARRAFDAHPNPDVVCWTALLLGYASNGDAETALGLFFRMKASGRCCPDAFTYIAAVKACASLAASGKKEEALEWGRNIHSEVGVQLNRKLASTLVDMYAKCGSMEEARLVFNAIPNPDVVSWNALLLGYADNGEGSLALNLFDRMTRSSAPDAVTYVAALKACIGLAASESKLDALERGKAVHCRLGACFGDATVQTTLIDMYAKCGSMVDAQRVFDALPSPSVASWTALIHGYTESDEGVAALELFSRMKNTPGCTPNIATYVSALKACACWASCSEEAKDEALRRGREIHLQAGDQQDAYLQCALIDMYAKCSSMEEARQVFDSIQDPNTVCCTALLQGYAENGEGGAALELFRKMRSRPGCPPDAVTYIAVLKACSATGALALGRKLQSEIAADVLNPHLVTCLVDFYSKCGSLAEACDVYDAHPRCKTLSTSNALLAGYARFGDSCFVFSHAEAMRDAGLRPDAVTLVCMLVCCSHAGLVEKARECFAAMRPQYGLSPGALHYSCMVDVLGRANRVNEAAEVIRRMPCKADAVTWMTLLCACRRWRNVEVGRWAFRSLMEGMQRSTKQHYALAFVVMAQLYASRSMQEEHRELIDRCLSGKSSIGGSPSFERSHA